MKSHSLFHMLNKTIDAFGDHDAVCDDNHRLSYNELGRCVAWLNHELSTYPVLPRSNVGILLGKSVMAVASIYGVFSVGAAYVPLDIEAPPEKIAAILTACDVDIVISSVESKELIDSLTSVPGVDFSTLWIKTPNDITELSGETIQFSNVSEHLTATILFTSGSTGEPKGVVICHDNIAPFLEWVVDEFELTSSDRLISHAPLFFDLSLLDIFAAMSVGASVYLIDSSKAFNHLYLYELIRREKITFWQSVPSALKALSSTTIDDEKSTCDDFCSVKKVLFAGEKLSGKFIQQLTTIFSAAKFYNVYGCTETNDTFFYPIPDDNSHDVSDEFPIGSPLPYVNYQVIDSEGKASREGELYINAPTNMQGYHGSESPFVTLDDGVAYYKTGDIVSIAADGLLRIKGRISNIIKINGYRISLLEVEDVVSGLPSVSEVAAFLFTDGADVNKLAVTVYCPQGGVSSIAVRRFCADNLPRYKRPDIVIIKDEPLAKTATGKIDRKFIEQNEIIGK